MNKWDSLDLNAEDLPRLDYLTLESLEPEMKEIFTSITDSERGVGTLSNGGLPGPFNGWMYTDPDMARALDSIGMAVRSNTTNVPVSYTHLTLPTKA